MSGIDRLPEAIEHFAQACRIRPEYAEAQANWGNALFRAGRVAEAIEHYEAALRINPGLTEVRQNLESARRQAAGPGE